jgi:N4-(beta-N-acetylglucosaminyl)-L-asparaginase
MAMPREGEDPVTFSRRDFVKNSVLGVVAAGVGSNAGALAAETQTTAEAGKRPIIVSANNGYAYVEAAYAFLKSGGDTLDAAMRVVKGPEDDPNDDSVGLGGIPNEEGVVELDACCMHGPTRRAGSVGGVRNIKNVSLVSRAVMEHTGHVMLVGEGAERFAVAMGFPRENLLTEHSRKIWLLWKEFNSDRDWWGPGIADPHWHAPADANRRPRSGRIASSSCNNALPIWELHPRTA